MCILATSEFSHEAVKKHQETVINALKTERDVSVRQRAVDLLYAMCDKSNAEEIVLEMLAYLETADYSIRFSSALTSNLFHLLSFLSPLLLLLHPHVDSSHQGGDGAEGGDPGGEVRH